MTREEQRTELLVHRIKDNCFEVAKKLLEVHDKQIKEEAIDECISEINKTCNCRDDAVVFPHTICNILEMLKEQKQ